MIIVKDYNYIGSTNESEKVSQIGVKPSQESAARYELLRSQTLFTVEAAGLALLKEIRDKKVFVLPDGLGVLTNNALSKQWHQVPYDEIVSIQISKNALAVATSGTSGWRSILEPIGSKKDAKQYFDMFQSFKRAGKLPSSLVILLVGV